MSGDAFWPPWGWRPEREAAYHAGVMDGPRQPSLDDKVAFLSDAASYGLSAGKVVRRETHMSWVFLAGERVYKLKKPVRFPYLDFSTVARRQAACRAELRLNRRLARDVYIDVMPLTCRGRALAIGDGDQVVDWLVVMRRLDENGTLERAIIENRLDTPEVERVAETLGRFYRQARPVMISPARHLAGWRRALNYDRQILLHSRLGLPTGLVRGLDCVLHRFLERHRGLLAERVRARRIVDAHGDLRPQHIWLNDPVKVIDCLEFNAALRAVDPMDEIAFLSLECERLGAAWAGRYFRARIGRALHDAPPEALFRFYRCYRAMLRARLAVAHLLEPAPPAAAKWMRLARRYLALAHADARRLEDALRTRAGRRGRRLRAGGGSPRRTAAPPAGHRPSGARHRAAAGTAARCR